MNTTDTADQALLDGLLSGDPRKVKALYDNYLPDIIRYVRSNSGSEADARDLFQEALIAIYRKLVDKDLELTVALRTYIQVICRNLWLRSLRKTSRISLQPPADMVEQVSTTETLGIDLERMERDRTYFRCFDQLGEKCRQILSWYFDKVPMKDIADRLDTSESFIKKKKFECKNKLISAIHKDPVFRELKNQ